MLKGFYGSLARDKRPSARKSEQGNSDSISQTKRLASSPTQYATTVPQHSGQTPSTPTVSFLERDACVRLPDAEAEEKRRKYTDER